MITFSLVSLTPVTALLIVLVLFLTLLVHQHNRKIQATEKQLRILKSDFQALLLCSRGVGDRLNWQQREFRNLIERQDRLELGGQGEPSYRQAAALLERGATPEEMIDTCDLTDAEAELIARLSNRNRKPEKIELVA